MALRSGKRPKIFGKEYDISNHVLAAHKVAEEAIAAMQRYVGDGSDIDNVIWSAVAQKTIGRRALVAQLLCQKLRWGAHRGYPTLHRTAADSALR
jgi:hypothetical protein